MVESVDARQLNQLKHTQSMFRRLRLINGGRYWTRTSDLLHVKIISGFLKVWTELVVFVFTPLDIVYCSLFWDCVLGVFGLGWVVLGANGDSGW